jgi:DNA-binding transcriptional ArsR family regulator
MEQLEYMEVEDPQVFEVLNNSLRFRVLRQLIEPRSIREVAEALGVPPTRLYYHFNLMEEAGIITVVETRKVGAMLQKVYQTVARGFRPSPKLAEGDLAPLELAKIGAGVVLDGAKADAVEALAGHFERVKAGETEVEIPGAIGRTLAFFTEDEARDFVKKLEKFIEEEFDSEKRASGGEEYGLTYVFFPLAGSDSDAD